jgi:hypothetical protein
MRTITTISMIFVLSFGYSQNYLTVGQVYDFNVGDAFQSAKSGSSIPSTYTTKRVLSKVQSANTDTLYYTIQTESYTFPNCMTCNPIYNTSISSVKYYNLSDSILKAGDAEYYLADSFKVVVDTNYINICGKRVRNRYQDPNQIPVPNVSPTQYLGALFIEGCGGPFSSYTYNNNGAATAISEALVYYKKGNDSCGTFFKFPLGLNDLALIQFDTKVFPNPSASKLKISATTELYRYNVSNVYGQIVQSGKINDNEINITTLPAGMYSLQIFDAEGNSVSKKFVKA